jgi:hypothetical protein
LDGVEQGGHLDDFSEDASSAQTMRCGGRWGRFDGGRRIRLR